MANALIFALHLNCWRSYMPAHLAHRLRVLGITVPDLSATYEALVAKCEALVAKRTPAAIGEYGYFRGHPGVYFEGEACERYADSLTPTVDTQGESVERPCMQCGLVAVPDGPDPCLGMLPGVNAACCGHGVEEPYVSFGVTRRTRNPMWNAFRGKEALAFFKRHGVGPRKVRKTARMLRHDANGTDA